MLSSSDVGWRKIEDEVPSRSGYYWTYLTNPLANPGQPRVRWWDPCGGWGKFGKQAPVLGYRLFWNQPLDPPECGSE